MRYSFRLAEVVGHVPDPRRRPGTIKAICDYTGLDRHQVAALLKNEVKYIPLEAMSKLCSYLIDRGYAKADELPGRLFGVEPEHFWELLARRRRLELCLGVRRGEATDTLDDAWVVASDSVLLGELLNGATTLGGTAEHRREGNGAPATPLPTDRPHPEFLRQSLVWSPGQATLAECQQMARSVYESFCETAGDKALVCLGSNKSNPVVEMMVAATFGCAAFVSQDDVDQPEQRQCPLFLRYRDHDPQFPSCFGGVCLAQRRATATPGIYFEKPDGSWECCAWGPTEDAAFVFYVHRESQGRLEMALGGFSGRATRLLAGLLARRGEEFWPPVYADEGLQVGAFVVRFRLTGPPEEHLEKSAESLPAEAEILRLDASVIARHLQHLDAPARSRRTAAATKNGS
jgi:hypothetical protein